MKKILALTTLLLAHQSFAQSYDYSKKWGLGGSYGYTTPIFGNNFNTEADGGESWSIYGRYHFNAADALEAAFTKHEFQDTTKALNVSDLTYVRRFLPMERFTPIAGIGVGVVDVNNYDPGSLKLGLKLRAGVEYALTNALNLGLNLDYQQVNKMLFADNLPGRNIHALAARVGLTWYFGGNNAVAATEQGMGANQVARNDKKELDLHYQTGDASINPAYNSDMKELAQFMEEHPSTKIELQGHTDNMGGMEMNQRLSQQRAEEVKKVLVKDYEIEPSRIETVGMGAEQPLADNETPEGRIQNRRVIGIIKQ